MVDFPYVKVITRGFIPQSQVCTLSPHCAPTGHLEIHCDPLGSHGMHLIRHVAHIPGAHHLRDGGPFFELENAGKCWKNAGKWWNMSAKWWKNDCNMVGKWRNSGYNSTKNAGEKMINRGPNRSSREKSQAILVLSHVKKPPHPSKSWVGRFSRDTVELIIFQR